MLFTTFITYKSLLHNDKIIRHSLSLYHTCGKKKSVNYCTDLTGRITYVLHYRFYIILYISYRRDHLCILEEGLLVYYIVHILEEGPLVHYIIYICKYLREGTTCVLHVYCIYLRGGTTCVLRCIYLTGGATCVLYCTDLTEGTTCVLHCIYISHRRDHLCIILYIIHILSACIHALFVKNIIGICFFPLRIIFHHWWNSAEIILAWSK